MRNKVIAVPRNDTTALVRVSGWRLKYENAGLGGKMEEKKRERTREKDTAHERKPRRASSVSRIWVMCLFSSFSIRLSPDFSFPPGVYTRIQTQHTHTHAKLCSPGPASAQSSARPRSCSYSSSSIPQESSLSRGYIGRSRVGR